MRIKFFLGIAAIAVSYLTAGCTKGDKFDPNKAVIIVTGTESNPVKRFVVNEAPATYVVSAMSTAKVTERTVVKFAIDPSLVEVYNKRYNAGYFHLENSAVMLDETEAVIEPGQAISTAVTVRLISDAMFEDGRLYMIPVTITSVQGGGMEVLEASRTIFLRISRTYTFNSLNLNSNSNAVATNPNTAPYGEYHFPENMHIDLNAGYTFEIKCYIDEWHPHTTNGYQISRLCNFNSGTGNMLRFGEDGMLINQLQWISPGGNIVSKYEFGTGQWYLISLVYDGFSFSLYVNGEKDTEHVQSASSDISFKAIEIGMSWVGTYRQRQRFLGKIAEMRVWDRALSTNQIQMGLCYVDPQSQGLRAYWKFDEGTGHIFHDATENGYDLDWSQAIRVDHASSESAAESTVNLSHAVKWFYDPAVTTCNP